MARRVKVFIVSLCAAFLFAFPAYAEFNTSDSINLNNIESDIGLYLPYLGEINAEITALTNQFMMVEGVTSLLHDIRDSLRPSELGGFSYELLKDTSGIQSQLSDILTALGQSDNPLPDNDAVYTFDNRYYKSDKPENDQYPGFIGYTSKQYVRFQSADGYPIFGYLSPGEYTFVFSSTSGVPVELGFESNQNNVDGYSRLALTDFYSFGSYADGVTRVRADFSVTDKDGLSFTMAYAKFNSSTSGYCIGYIFRRSDNSLVGAIDGDQQQVTDEVESAGQQQSQQEEQLWTNVNAYKDDLTFSIADWSEAASGLSYVTGVFMIIWNNSPTQVITLSLMLGIAMLCIGRGVSAAVRVSHKRSDE